MALAAASIIEVAATGSDGNAGSDTNAGMFNPTNANMATDLTTTSNTGNTSAPVVSSASYNFVASDVGHWVFVKSGTNWTPGWYKIASVASNQATLSAAVGAAVLYATGGPYAVSTLAGCATTGTPTSGTWTVDYSQGGTARISFTDLASVGAGSTFTSVANPVGKNFVANVINITAGTNFTTGLYEIASTATITATTDRACTTAAGVSGVGKLGGCLASPGQAGANHVAGNHIFVKLATYSITSASTNIASGCLSMAATTAAANQTATFGYNSIRTDAPIATSRPILQASGISTFTLITQGNGCACSYLILDGASLTSSRGIAGFSATGRVYYVSAKNCTNSGFSNINTYLCDATGCATQPAFSTPTSGYTAVLSVAWSNTITGSSGYAHVFGISVNNSGASSDGFSIGTSANWQFINCTAYNNGRDGFRLTPSFAINQVAINNLSYGNASGTGFNTTATFDGVLFVNNAAGGNATNFSTSITSDTQIGNITLTADPFTNKSGGDFSLNSTAGGGALCQGLSQVMPGQTSTTSYLYCGAVGPRASGGGMSLSRAFTERSMSV